MLGQIADIASLLAALGVFASVAVLAYELRQTRHQAELSNWRDVLQTLTDYKARTQDPHLAGILVRGHADYGSLGPADAITFGMYLEQGVHIYGNFLKHNDAQPWGSKVSADAAARMLEEVFGLKMGRYKFGRLIQREFGRAWGSK